MRKFNLTIVLLCVSFLLGAGEKAPEKVTKLADSTLKAFGSEKIIVDAVKAQNAKGMKQSDIDALDTKWKAHAGIADYMQALKDSPCGKFLIGLKAKHSFIEEAFVMDNQGGNVCMSDKTSDYWQGDEAKFKKSFNKGKGKVFVDEVQFDDSTQGYLVQVSVPVMDGGKAIGAITFGVNVEKVK